jgi:two-component system osmolarity sensor histidine kinase EnvZ
LFWRTFGWLVLLAFALVAVWWLVGRSSVSSADRSAFSGQPPAGTLGFVAAALACTLAALGLTAWLVNRPYAALSQVALRLREGDLDARLDEAAVVREIQEVNASFNRMARDLARVDQDRAVMLAGLSHDLRTPLARLRLEAEMSVTDTQALSHMAADIGQLDAIIDKFTEYARPEVPAPQPVDLRLQLHEVCGRFEGDGRLRIAVDLPPQAVVMADPTDLQRVLVNLMENAARYARQRDGGPAEVMVTAQAGEEEVVLLLRDRGPGVPAAQLGLLTQPFFRGNAARTEASGAGLGLAIVDKAVQRMKGALTFRNLPGHGLEVCIRLPRAASQG